MISLNDDGAGSTARVDVSTDLWKVLEEARRVGFIGPSSMRASVRHAQGFAYGLDEPPRRLLDLGSGGGLPGLVLLEMWPRSKAALLDSQQRRSDFLRWAVETLDLSDRVKVVGQRAEVTGRSQRFRGQFDLVTARGFGRPAVTAECAAPFLRTGGRVIVSEPPAGAEGCGDDESDRWPAEGLALVGLAPGRSWTEPFHYQELLAENPCPDRFPRRVGAPAKRPLF